MDWVATLITAVISGSLGFFIAERRLASENIIQERKDWREHIRKVAADAHRAIVSGQSDQNTFGELRATLALRLDPPTLQTVSAN
jgi:hypothetical protein